MTELTLVIETSSNITSVAIGNRQGILFESSTESRLELATLVRTGLAASQTNIREITCIAVDVGPGRLISIRNGVAFANSLAFATGTPIHPFFSFDLMGFEAWKNLGIPVLCTAKGNEGNAYVALYEKGVSQIGFGPLEDLVRKATQGLSVFSVAGEYKDAIKDMAFEARVHDSEIYFSKAQTFFLIEENFRPLDRVNFVAPFSESSPLLHQQSTLHQQ